jgi:hypothetical protein
MKWIKFINAYKQPKLNQDGINHLNRMITSNEAETVIKSLPIKSPGPDGFMAKFCQTFKEEPIPLLLKLFRK